MATLRPRIDVARLTEHPWLVATAVLVVGHLALILTRTYQPAGDWAFIELRTSDVASAHPPLTGAWSRYGWNHPGPILYALLAVPRLLLGGSWRGLWIGAMAINLTAVVTGLVLMARHGRLAVTAFAVAVWWTIAAATPHLFTDPWNASVVILPLITMAAAVVAVRTGDRRGIAVAVVVFVAVAQTHAAYGVALAPAVAVVLVVGARQWRRSTVRALVAGAVLCVPVLVDTLVDWPGNLWRALRFTTRSAEPVVGLGEALRVLGRATSVTFVREGELPTFVGNVAGTPWGTAPFAGLVALVAAYVLARRRRWTVWVRAAEAIALLWFGATVMTWRTRGPLLIWLTTWTVALAALTWCVAGAVAIRCVAPRVSAPTGRTWRIVGTAAVGVATIALAVVDVSRSVGVGYPFQEYTAVIAQFERDGGHLADEPILIDLAGDTYVAGAVQSGLIARLDLDGRHPRGRPDQALQLGDRRVAGSLDGRRLLVQVEARREPPGGATLVSAWDPLTDEERATADRLVDELGALLAGEGLDERIELLGSDLAGLAALDGPPAVAARQADFDRLASLHARGERIVLYLIDG